MKGRPNLHTEEEKESWLNFCACNCGQKCSQKFVHGHNGRGIPRSIEVRKVIGEKNRISLLGKKQSPETIKKRSLKLTGRKCTPEQNAAKSARLMGHSVSQETIEKIRIKNTGRKHSEEQNVAKSKRQTGVKRSPEFGQKMSLRMKGKPKTAEHRKNIGLSQLGKKHSAERNARKSARQMGHPTTVETRAKLSASNIGKHNRPHTEAEKINLSLSLLGKNKYIRTDKMRENMSIAHLGIIPSDESNLKRSASLKKTWSERGNEILDSMMNHKKWSRFPYIQKSGLIIQMRSSWEIKFAIYLDALNILWQYEPRGFLLSNGHRYFPDFLFARN